MGTNYYWIVNDEPCEACGHENSARYHIGKSSAGWEFLFSNGYSHDNVPELLVSSWKDWKDYLSKDGIIRDEYGKEISLDDFIKIVENRYHPKGLRNATDAAKSEGYYSSDRYWKDNEGNAFTTGDFT